MSQADRTAAIDAIHQVIGGPADADVAVALGRYPRVGLGPDVVDDPGDPPALESSKTEHFDYEAMLGRYDPDTVRITTWPKGIAHVAAKLDVHPLLLRRVVSWHENAHALHHRGISKADAMPDEIEGILRRQDTAFRAMSVETSEQVAQLATLVAIRTRLKDADDPRAKDALERTLDAFLRLMDRQSRAYRIPRDVRTMGLKRLRRKIGLLVEMTDAGMSPSADQVARILY